MSDLQSKAHDLGEEVTNLHQQADATARVVRSLDVQLETITTEVDGTTSSLLRAEDELAVKKAVLQRRLIDIYKRGPLYTTQALLAARTFGELLGRYKYLHELAVRDRSLVTRVEDLYDQVAKQRQQLVRLREEFERSRQEKQDEEGRLRTLEENRAKNLSVVKRSAKETQARLAAIGRDETRLTNVIAAFEEAVMRHGRPEMVMSDKGAAFWSWKGVSRFTALLTEIGIDHLEAEHKEWNGKVEVFNANLHKELFDAHRFCDMTEMRRRLAAHLHWYNHARTHHALGGLLVPADRYYGRVDEVLARIEAGAGRDASDLLDLRERCLDLFRVTSEGGVAEVWLLGQRLLELPTGARP